MTWAAIWGFLKEIPGWVFWALLAVLTGGFALVFRRAQLAERAAKEAALEDAKRAKKAAIRERVLRAEEAAAEKLRREKEEAARLAAEAAREELAIEVDERKDAERDGALSDHVTELIRDGKLRGG